MITGDFRYTSLALEQDAVRRMLRDAGAVVQGNVNAQTNLLVRAPSPNWKYVKFGTREQRLARIAPRGRVLDAEDLPKLLRGRPVAPHRPLTVPEPDLKAAAARVVGRFEVGQAYREASGTLTAAQVQLFTKDPHVAERGLRAHADTQNALAAMLRDVGIQPMSPTSTSPNYDIAFEHRGALWVGEVKSTTIDNEAVQLRLGLGQVLEFAWRCRKAQRLPVKAVLSVEKEPLDSAWVDLAGHSNVLLTWPPFVSLRNRLSAPPKRRGA